MRVVFIINSAQNQRCIKRVNEFVKNGYEVAAYAFTRGKELRNKPNFDLQIIGSFTNDTTYKNRLKLMFQSIKKVIKLYENEEVLFYLFSLDIAMLYRLQCGRKYIYEESDLVHTYVQNKLVRNILRVIDKKIVLNSVLTVFTSEGFARYHFGEGTYKNNIIVPNRLTPDILNYPLIEKKDININKIRFGFVGAVRFKSLYNLAITILETFPQHEFHFYGTINSNRDGDFESLDKYDNCYLHGVFQNPVDLPAIYSNVDILISTYDMIEENVKYAEPNKLYESIYFETPIVVTSGTFLANKVKKLGIGYDVDPMNKESVINFVKGLSSGNIQIKINNCKKIEKKETLNINDELFKRLESVLGDSLK